MLTPIEKFKQFIFFSLLLLCAVPAVSQKIQDRNWLLGDRTKWIQFDRPKFLPTLVSRPAIAYGTGGGAVATDANTGNLLFYTDGDNVYDATHTLVTNSGLGGNTAINQPAVICPVPGTPNQYYIFTINIAGNIEQATVQLAAFGSPPPLASIISKNVATGISNRSEGMIVVQNVNGIDSWLITQNTNSDTYTVTSVTSGGLSSSTFNGNGVPLTAANLSFFDNGNGTGKIAVSPKDANKNVVIFDFDKSTGNLTFNSALSSFLMGTGSPSNIAETIYDTEWSVTGDTLYISKNGDPSAGVSPDVLQVVLTAPVTSPVSILNGLTLDKSWGLQMGPDSVIYHIYQVGAQFFVGSIKDKDHSGPNQVVYTPNVFNFNFNAKQFPSFSPPVKTNYSVTFVADGSCTNSPIVFFPTVTPAADSVVWDFGDGSPPTTSWSPMHTFTNASSTVTATAYLNGVAVATANQALSLTQFNVQISLQSDTTACSCELVYPRAPKPIQPCATPFQIKPSVSGGSGVTYQWYGPSGLLAGQTGQTLNVVDSAGYYYVVASSGGCSVSAGQNINEYHVQDQRANKWVFGDLAGIDFNPLYYTPPKNTTAPVAFMGPVNSNEGVAVICDRNGQIVLSTDGYQVYDRTGTPLIPSAPAPPVIPAATQSALIIPVAGNETLYYIFTADPVENGTYEVNYMLFDLTKGPNGSIVDPDNNPATDPRVTLFTKSTERLTGNNNWLITHEYGNNTFRVYPVATTGIGAPVFTDIGSVHSSTTMNSARGYMKLGAQNRLAVALNDGTSNFIELFDFIDTTGVLTNYRQIPVPEAGEIYGVEFSPAANKLYATVENGGTSVIYEYAIDSLGTATFVQKTAPISDDLGDLQMGPNGSIYIAANNENYVYFFQPDETIYPTPVPTAGLNTLQKFSLAPGTNSNLGLPNFIQSLGNPLQSPGMSISGNCPNVPVSFSGTPSDQYRDDFLWTIKDPAGATVTTSTKQTFQYTFTTPGTYKVTLDITSKCMVGNVVYSNTQNLVINAPPANPTFLIPPDDNLICIPPKQLEATPASNPNLANLSFLWNTTETTRQISINLAGTYSVAITDNSTGCTSNGSINIFDNRPTVDLGPDFPMCSDDTKVLDAGVAQNQNNTISYKWQIDNGATVSTARQLSVNTALLGAHDYKVTVTDGSCSVSDDVVITVNPIPVFNATATVLPACGASNGQVQVNITSSGTYTIDFTGQAIRNNQSTSSLYTGLTAGTFNITLTDELTGCDANSSVGVGNTSVTVSAANPAATCSPVGVQLNIAGGTGPYKYIFTDQATGQSSTIATYNGALTNAMAPGNYVVEVDDSSSPVCKATTNVQIPSKSPINITSLNQTCNTITATTDIPNPNFVWSTTPPGGIASSSTSSNTGMATLVPGANYTVKIDVTDAANNTCPTSQTFQASASNLVANFNPSDLCKQTVTLTATPAGSNYVYNWSLNGSPVGGGQILTITNSGNYSVDVRDNSTGCIVTSPVKDIEIPGPLTVTVLAPPALCEGTPFTLTAVVSLTQVTMQWERDNVVIPNSNVNPLVDNTEPGVYTATATLTTGACAPVSYSINVNLNQGPQGQLPVTKSFCEDGVLLDAGNPPPGNATPSYVWLKNDVVIPGETGQTYTANEVGNYTVKITSAAGCTGTDQTQVIRDCTPVLLAPTAFNPTSTFDGGKNAKFIVFPKYVSEEGFHIFIFNRWGEMIFQSDNINFTWDGTDARSGAAVPPGTYSWVAKFKGEYQSEKQTQEKHGGVVLLR